MTHYFSDEPLGETHHITVSLAGRNLQFLSAPGMFSKDKLDRGSELLICEADVPKGAHILDLGCGIGVVGILRKIMDPTAKVTQTDVTDKAVTLTSQNSRALHAKTEVVKSDGYDALGSKRFDCILCNPPRAAGKAVIERLISQAPDHIQSGGSLQIVALGNKGGATYARMMKNVFGNVEVIARGSGFKVYKSVVQPV